MSNTQHTPGPWVQYNAMNAAYETPDGTKVAAELADNVACIADVLQIAAIREAQRAAIAKATGGAV